MTRVAVITGIGVVLPETNTLAELWDQQLVESGPIGPLSERLWGSTVNEERVGGHLSPRLAKKLDAFSRYAMVAAQRAIDDADLPISDIDRDRCGVFIGNAFGGWRFTEPELRHLHCDGPRVVSPFQATSWFPAAPQGQITIHYGIKGCSKTFMADRASSLLSAASAARMIERGDLDVALAGGTESTNTEFVRAALENIPVGMPAAGASAGTGFAVSEGAVVLILEDSEYAARRGARAYAQMGAFAMANAPCESDRYGNNPDAFVRAMRGALGNREATLVMPDACGLSDADQAETEALQQVCGKTPLRAPKRKYGHSFGAEGALDIAYAGLMLQRQQILPVMDNAANASTLEEKSARIDSVLINGCATGGAACSLLLTARGV